MVRVMGVVSGKGGVGKTTVAVNLAYALKNYGQRVVLVDCNLSTPHMAYYIGTSDYKYTLNDVLLGKVDVVSALHNFDGIRHIPASLNLKDIVGVDPVKLKKHVKSLMIPSKVDFILLDSAPGLGREALAVLDAADELLFVTTPFSPMLNDVIRCRDVLREIKGDKTLNMVLNMVTGEKHELHYKTIADVVNIPIVGQIPYDKSVLHSLVFKSPVVSYKPKSFASTGFMQLAAKLTNREFKTPLNFKLYHALNKIKNSFLPSSFSLPTSPEEIKEDITPQGN